MNWNGALFSVGISLFLQASLANAGAVSGGGGDAVVCFSDRATRDRVRQVLIQNREQGRNGHLEDPLKDGALNRISSVEMLDIYRGKSSGILNPIQDEIWDTNLPVDQILSNRLAILARKSSFHSTVEEVRSRIKNSDWIGLDGGVVEIDDSFHREIFNENCLLVQLAVQEDMADKSVRIYYDRRIYAKMRPVQQAALILHEWLYFAARDQGAWNSRGVRDLVALLFKKNLESMSPAEINQTILASGIIKRKGDLNAIETVMLGGVPIAGVRRTVSEVLHYLGLNKELIADEIQWCISSVSPYEVAFQNQRLAGVNFICAFDDRHVALFQPQNTVSIGGLELKQVLAFDRQSRLVKSVLSKDQPVMGIQAKYEFIWFHPNGSPAQFTAEGKQTLSGFELTGGKIKLYPNGTIREIHGLDRGVYEGVPYVDEIELFPNGKLRSCYVPSLPDGSFDWSPLGFKIRERRTFRLYENGQIESAVLKGRHKIHGYEVAEWTEFYDSGKLRLITKLEKFPSGEPGAALQYQNRRCQLPKPVGKSTDPTIQLFESGKLKECQLENTYTRDGVSFENNSKFNTLIQLSENGKLLSFKLVHR